MNTIDLAKAHKPLYTATRKIAEIKVEPGVFFVAEGQGRPGGEAFQDAIQALFGTTYTVKFTCKKAGELDFTVCKLECQYLSEPCKTPIDQWRWRLMLRVPEAVTVKHLAAARKALKERKGMDASAVKRARLKGGRAIQVLHVGPYEDLGTTYERLTAYAAEHGLAPQPPCHEIYLNDPRRTAPTRLKTIVRMPVKKAPR